MGWVVKKENLDDKSKLEMLSLRKNSSHYCLLNKVLFTISAHHFKI